MWILVDEHNEFLAKLDIQICFYQERIIPQYKNDLNNLIETKHTLSAYNEILQYLFGSTPDKEFKSSLSKRINNIRSMIDTCRNYIDMLNYLDD